MSDIGEKTRVIRLPGTLVLSPGKKPKLKIPKTKKITGQKASMSKELVLVKTPAATAPVEEKPKSSRKWLWIAGAVAATAALIWLVTRKTKRRPLAERMAA